MSEMVEMVARAIWESQAPYRNWDARMTWYRATPEAKESALNRGAHPDNFNHNDDIEQAFKAARAAILAMREPTEEMIDNAFVNGALPLFGVMRGVTQAEDMRRDMMDSWQAMIDAALTEKPRT